MSHQIRVPPKDKDLLRFLWWPKGDTAQEMEECRMTVHLFGAISSPSCAIYALQSCAKDSSAQHRSEVIQTVLGNFYVDDCLTSVAAWHEELFALRFLALWILTRAFMHWGDSFLEGVRFKQSDLTMEQISFSEIQSRLYVIFKKFV